MFQMSKIFAVAMVMVWTVMGADSSNSTLKNIPKSCLKLRTLFKNVNVHRKIRTFGKAPRELVQWGSGDTYRASAALLYVTLKYVQGYKDAILEQGYDTLCDVATNFKLHDEVLIHVAAKTSKNDLNCPALVSCTNPRDVCTVAGPSLHVMGLAMAPIDVQLNVSLSDQARKNTNCTEMTWTKSKLLDPLSLPDLEKCDFVADMKNVFRYDDYQQGNEYQNPNCITNHLYGACILLLLDLDLNDTYYKELTKSWAKHIEEKQLPLQLIQLKNNFKDLQMTNSFFYLHQSHDSTPAFRVAPANILQQFAPRMFSVVRKFAPSSKDIKEILKLEMRHDIEDIEDAACQYFLQFKKHQFKTWASASDPIPWVLVLLCEGDPNNNWYIQVSGMVASTLNKFTVNFTYTNCSDENQFNQELFRWQNDMQWARMIGAVGAGAGASLAAKAANSTETQVVLYDVPGDTVNLSNHTRTSTGRVKPLALALEYFLKQNGWRRIAIISDRTQLAQDFTKNLCTNSTHIAARERFIDVKNLNTSAKKVLLEFRDESTFIFFLNTDSKTAGKLLCAALKLEMSDNKRYAWIVREWGTYKNISQMPCNIAGMRRFIVTYWWRGHNEANLPAEASNRKWREQINKLSKGIWPPLTAPLVDAILLLWYQINATLQIYPELQDNLHVDGNAKKIAESFSHKSDVAGTVQSLKQKDSALEKPLVFLYEWHEENNCYLLAIWKVENEAVIYLSTIRETYPNGPAPLDGSTNCITVTSGGPYDPTCYDAAAFVPIAIVAVIPFMVYLVYRHWMNKLKERDHIMQMRMLARSEHIAVALKPYIVSRSSLDIREELGIGNFGRVHFGMLTFPKRTIPVAVKSLREEASLAEESQFLHEACILSRLSHVNVVRLVGVCVAEGPPLVMMEHAFFCDLRRYLTSRRHYAEIKDSEMYLQGVSEASSISPRELTRLAREAAAALDYLCFKKIVHRDVRAANCLIDDSRTLKLADFGMARQIAASKTEENTKRTAQLTSASREPYPLRTMSEPMSYSYICKRRRAMFPVPWMAPESIARGEFSSASDIWSLGVMMFEIVMLGQRPFGSWSPQRVYQYLIRGGIPQLPLEISYNAREVIEMCWWKEPRKRATAAAIRAHLFANPTALRHAVGARSANLANTKNKSWSTSDSGYSERRDIFAAADPCISTC